MVVEKFSEIKEQGTLWQAQGHKFVTKQVMLDELVVARLENGYQDELMIRELKSTIANGDVELLETHSKEDEITLPEDQLVELLSFVSEDPAMDLLEVGEDAPADAMLALEKKLPEGAYWFRFRDDED